MDTNNKISVLVESTVPFFVRNDHQNFVRFLEAYYEWLEQPDSSNNKQYNVVTRAKNVRSFNDIDDTSVDAFTNELYKTFLKLIPEDTAADKAIILKNAKDFYRARGTEKSIRFLMRVLFDDQETDFYYPKKDVLRASDGKWFIEKSIKFSDVLVNGNVSTSTADVRRLVDQTVTGSQSGATAAVERIDFYYEGGTEIRELKISNQTKNFISGEQVVAQVNGDTIAANTFSGILNTVTLTNSGSLYKVGDLVAVESNTGSGAIVRVDSVTTGNIRSILVAEGGAGYRANDAIFIADSTGTGASANLLTVKSDGSVHPNSYNIVISLISSEANTNISNSIYSTLNNANANVTLANAFTSFFVYSNTGPALISQLLTSGQNYSANPLFITQANTRITNLGILGRMEIYDGGSGYSPGDLITIENVPGGYGVGGRANVTNVDANGTITSVGFIAEPGHIVGGSGYSMDYLPQAKIISLIFPSADSTSNTADTTLLTADMSGGFGANIAVTSLLGFGAKYIFTASGIGQILRLTIVARGSGYETPPVLNFTGIGDGTAQAVSTIVTGAFSYPGRWLNDDGHISSYNFLQDRDYYQNFSYVVKTKESIEKYRKALKDLVHPAGMKLFGEYLFVDDDSPVANSMKFQNVDTEKFIEYSNRPYQVANLNANITPGITISMNTAGLSQNSEVRISFNSGNIASYNANGIYYVSNVINSNAVLVYSGTKIPVSMNVANWETVPTGITFKDDGRSMYVVGQTNDRVVMYDLQYPWDISSARFVTRSATVGDATPTGVTFSSNGKFMYVSGSTTRTIRQFSLTESWNVNVSSLVTTFNVITQDTSPQDLFIGNNGTLLYVVGSTNDRVYQYRLNVPWNVGSANYVSNVSVAATDTVPFGLHFKDDGKIMYIAGDTNNRLYQYDLSEAWNVQTAVYRSNSVVFTSIDATPQSIYLRKNGDLVYILGSTNDLLIQIPLKESWNISTMVLDIFNTESANSGNVSITKSVS